MKRTGQVKLSGRLVGTIEEEDRQTVFTYSPEWLSQPDAVPVTAISMRDARERGVWIAARVVRLFGRPNRRCRTGNLDARIGGSPQAHLPFVVG
ncbi:MAG: hypothetical protein GXY83_03820 [Rhodopirellula sp.]|nr:hypothetical protein [Rhodopirellula sp.]